MTKPELKKFAELIAMLAEGFRQSTCDLTIRAYLIGCDGVPIKALEAAVRKALQESRFMPTASELRELAGYAIQSDDDLPDVTNYTGKAR